MTNHRSSALLTCALLTAAIASAATAQDAAPDGAQLYQTKACMTCHGPDGRTPILPIYPKVAGQPAGYLYNQMRDIKNGTRNNGQSVVMLGIMAGVNEEEMQALATWIAAQ